MKLAAFAILSLSLLPSAITAWRFRDMPQLGKFHDDGLYWATAASIAERHEYRIVSLPGEPPQTKYPPLFPAFLSLAWLVDPIHPSNVPLGVGLAWLWFPVFVWGSWLFFRRAGFGETGSLVLSATIALLPQSQLAASILMADLMFAALLLLSLRLLDDRPLAAGLAAGACYLARTAALPLLLVVPVTYGRQGRSRDAVRFLAAALPAAIAWHTWSAWARPPGSGEVTAYYTNYLGYQFLTLPPDRLLQNIWDNTGHLANSVSLLVSIDAGDLPPFSLLRPLIAVACVSGIVRMVRQGRAVVYAAFAALYGVMLLLWYFPPNPRFLIPIMPLLIAGLFTELAHLCGMIRAAWRKTPVAAAILALALAGLGWIFAATARAQYEVTGPKMLAGQRAARDRLEPAYAWIRANLPPDAAFFAIGDPLLYLSTRRHALRPGGLEGLFVTTAAGLNASDRLRTILRENKLGYLLLTADDFSAGAGLKFDPGSGLEPLFSREGVVILKNSTSR